MDFGLNIFPEEWSLIAPVTLAKQLIDPCNFSKPKKAKINASLKSMIFSEGTIILTLDLKKLDRESLQGILLKTRKSNLSKINDFVG